MLTAKLIDQREYLVSEQFDVFLIVELFNDKAGNRDVIADVKRHVSGMKFTQRHAPILEKRPRAAESLAIHSSAPLFSEFFAHASWFRVRARIRATACTGRPVDPHPGYAGIS